MFGDEDALHTTRMPWPLKFLFHLKLSISVFSNNKNSYLLIITSRSNNNFCGCPIYGGIQAINSKVMHSLYQKRYLCMEFIFDKMNIEDGDVATAHSDNEDALAQVNLDSFHAEDGATQADG